MAKCSIKLGVLNTVKIYIPFKKRFFFRLTIFILFADMYCKCEAFTVAAIVPLNPMPLWRGTIRENGCTIFIDTIKIKVLLLFNIIYQSNRGNLFKRIIPAVLAGIFNYNEFIVYESPLPSTFIAKSVCILEYVYVANYCVFTEAIAIAGPNNIFSILIYTAI